VFSTRGGKDGDLHPQGQPSKPTERTQAGVQNRKAQQKDKVLPSDFKAARKGVAKEVAGMFRKYSGYWPWK